MSIARSVVNPLAAAVSFAISGRSSGGLSASDTAKTVSISLGTKQLIVDPLDGEVVGRWLGPSQSEPTGLYLISWRLHASTERQILVVPNGFVSLSYRKGPDETGAVAFSYTEVAQAAPLLRDADISTDMDTFASTSQAVAAYQGSVTPAADAGRFRNMWYTKNLTPDRDIADWSVFNTVTVGAQTTIEGKLCNEIIDINGDLTAGNNVVETYPTAVAGKKFITRLSFRAKTASDVGDVIIFFTRGATAGSEGTTKVFVPLTLHWQTACIYKNFDGTASGNLQMGIRWETGGDNPEFYAADPQIEDVTGFTTIHPSRYVNSAVDEWSPYHPTSVFLDKSAHWSGTTAAGGTGSIAGAVVESPVQRLIGTFDFDRKPHLNVAPHVGARA